jgi:eukaryotic-like serine/threonine-protein kinase
MPTPAPEDFWKLLADSRLTAGDVLASLRREHARETAGQPPAASGDAASAAIAKWLIQRGVLTKWQARRLINGDSGPFFVGDYRLMERLENDGPGRLFRGRHEPSGRSVCLMLLDRKLCQRVDVWTEVVRRTTIAHDAIDPILSRTWALEQAHGNRFIVCEDVTGLSLADELARLGPLPPAEACRLMLPIFLAVAELHRRGVVHGDLSLDALRREPASGGDGERMGRVRLLQVPLAGDPHAVPGQTPIDATERVSTLGRRASFVAPELMLPGRFSDERSDVYALGCMLHALLTGVAPCWQGDAQRTLSQAAFVGPPPLGPPQVPVEVATLVSYLVARDPASRYPDAAEAADALAGCIGLPPVSGSLPPQATAVGAGGQAVSPVASAAQPAIPPSGAAASPAAAAFPGLGAGGGAGSSAIDLATRAARKRAARLGMIGLGVAGGVLVLSLAIALWQNGSALAPRTQQKKSNEEPQGGVAKRETPQQKPGEEQTDDQTEEHLAQSATSQSPGTKSSREPQLEIVESADLPWASPTTGKPPSLAYLPPGSQLILLARPAAIVADQEGRQFVTSLGPRVAEGIATLDSLCGCRLEEIAEVQAGWQAGGDAATASGDMVSGWTVRFREPSPLLDDADARAKAWGETTERDVDGETVHAGTSLSFWLPAAEQGRVLVMGPAAILDAMVAARNAGPEQDDDALAASLPQDLEQLVGMLDRTRHLTLLGSPYYLLTDGRPLMAGPLAGLVEPLGSFFGDGVKAAALSLHFGDNFYAEVDTIATRAEPAKSLAGRLAQQIEKVADAVETYCDAINPHPYGRKLVRRLPSMIRVVAANARCGAEGKGVVLNTYLPRHAGHNLVLASELALEQTPGSAVAAVPGKTPAAAPAGSAGGLQKKMTLVFAKDTLEKSIQMLSDEIGIPMEILGGDLQLEGITKNQSFELDERDKSADAVLRTILAKSDLAGRLVYVIRKRDGVESIEITTKAAAAERGDTLPPGY